MKRRLMFMALSIVLSSVVTDAICIRVVLQGNSTITQAVRMEVVNSQRESQNLIAPLPEGAYRSAQGFKGTTLDANLFHLGKDYCVDASADPHGVVLKGTRFYAIGSGRVVDVRFSEPAYRKDGVGNYITVDHGNNLIAVYMHLAKVLVKQGQEVDSTTPLGEAGDVILHPKPNCSHLHLEIRNDGVTSLNVPPNLRYSYASRDGKTRYSRPLGDESAVNTWIDANFLDPEQILSPRVSNPPSVGDDWNSFWASFRTVVRTRDRSALRNMMSPVFLWALGDEESPDQALRGWGTKDWQELRLIVNRSPAVCDAFGIHGYCLADSHFGELLFTKENGQWKWKGLMGD